MAQRVSPGWVLAAALLGCAPLGCDRSSNTATGTTTSGTSSGTSSGSSGSYCSGCSTPSSAGKIGSEIDEASGLTASKKHPGRYYVHNDSGDSPRFFAIDEKGGDFGTYEVTNAEATDWEDMALGPCGNTTCLYLGDVGDNLQARSSYHLYRVVEPAALTAGEHEVTAEDLPFTYPDGSHNCETVMVHPKTGAIFVLTKKGSGPSGLYTFPAITPGSSVTLVKLGEVTVPTGDNRFTAGDIHPQASGVLLRSYTNLFYYPLDASLDPAKAMTAALSKPGCSVPASLETQGETVAWAIDGKGWLTVSEGDECPIIRVTCP